MTLEPLAAALRSEGGLLAGAVAAPPYPDAPLGERVGEDLGPVVEAIREGYELHYGTPRVLAPGEDDLALLAGDRLYAIGLDKLAALGDVDAVAELADLISLVAQAQAAGDEDLSEAVWEAGAAAIGWGCTPGITAAKAAARVHDPDAAAQLRAAAACARDGAR